MQKLIIKEMNVLRREGGRNGWIMLLMVVCGLVVGGFLGELLGKYFPILRLTFGFDFNINMFSILGIVIAIYIYRKL